MQDAQAAPDWLFYPDYRGANPYQSLLAQSLPAPWQAAAGDIGQAQQQLQATGRCVFHLHWEDAVYRAAATDAESCALAAGFIAECAAFRAAGGRLVWTVHNAAPHENRHPMADAGLRAEMAGLADCVHVHGAEAAGLMRGLGVAPERLLVHPHPAFHGAYPDDITAAAARRYFAIPDNATVFVFFGAWRAYKGLDVLQHAFAALRAENPQAWLIIAGRGAGGDTATAARYLVAAPGLILVPRHIEDAAVQYVMRAADFVVLPYRRILTSGAAMLALGFDRPLIAPNLAAFAEQFHDGVEWLGYPPDAPDGLLGALRRACALGGRARAAMSEAARAHADATSFTALATRLTGMLNRPHCQGQRAPALLGQ